MIPSCVPRTLAPANRSHHHGSSPLSAQPKARQPPGRGMPNPVGANHCYVNTSLQALSTIPQFTFILTASVHKSLPSTLQVAQTSSAL